MQRLGAEQAGSSGVALDCQVQEVCGQSRFEISKQMIRDVFYAPVFALGDKARDQSIHVPGVVDHMEKVVELGLLYVGVDLRKCLGMRFDCVLDEGNVLGGGLGPEGEQFEHSIQQLETSYMIG